jgi:hypothetical protein
MPRPWAAIFAAAVGLAAAPPEAGAAPAWCHVVRRGEHLTRIARQAGTTAARLRQLNAIGRDGSVRPGDVLALPVVERLAMGRLVSTARPIPARPGHRARENAGADADGLSRISTRAAIVRFVRAGLLVRVPEMTLGFKVVAVPAWRRVTRPWSRLFLDQLGTAVRALFGGRLRVTDLTRTEAVQLALGEHNANAASARGPLASTHLTGAAIDLSKIEHSDAEIAWLRVVLRRLSTQGLVDAIEEFTQPHFHVLVRRAYARYGARLRAAAAIGC